MELQFHKDEKHMRGPVLYFLSAFLFLSLKNKSRLYTPYSVSTSWSGQMSDGVCLK
jgi:hypothetical protein